MAGALSNIRVIELSQVLAGPFCGYQLALLGAEVVKVELPDSPDCARGRGPIDALNDRGLGLTYQVQGGNKLSLALDIRQPQGREALLRLADSADVLVENYVSGTMDDLGLGYEVVRARNPGIVYCSMTGYGALGPDAGRGAYDNTIQAASGAVAQSCGVKPGVSFVDYAAGYSAAFAIAAALIQRQQTGQGCHITASMLEVAISLMAPEAAAAQAAPDAPKRREAGILQFDTADGQLMLGAFKPAQYRKLAACLAAVGHPVPRVAAVADWSSVWENSDNIRVALQDVFILRPATEWIALLKLHDVPAETVASLSDAVASPQLAVRGYFVPSPADASLKLPLAGYRMSAGGPALHRAPPELGRDTRAVLASAGFDEVAIDAMIAEGVAR